MAEASIIDILQQLQGGGTQDLGGASGIARDASWEKMLAERRARGEDVSAYDDSALRAAAPPSAADVRPVANLALGGGSAALEAPGGQMTRLFGARDIAGPTGNSNPYKSKLSPNLQEILDSADQVASSLSDRKSELTQTLLPNPYGQGSYDPNDQAAVAKVKEQGVQQQKIERAKQFLSSDFLSRLPQGTDTKAIVQGILEDVGAVKSEAQRAKELAKAKAEGELEAGKGVKTALPQELLNSAGTEGFQKEMDKAIASGTLSDPTKQLQLEDLHDKRLKAATLTDPEAKTLISLKGSAASLDRIEEAYKATPAYKTGKVSDTLKQALALSNKGATAIELSGVFEKLTPEERKFAALYNTFGINLRRVSEDSRFSNFDSQKVLDAVGNPIVGKDLYLEQLGSTRDELKSRNKNYQESLTVRGKKLGSLGSEGQPQAAASVPAGAVEYLKAHPEAKEQFKAKYGYLP